MVILQVNKFFHEKGGSERYFLALSQAQAGRGHEVVHFSMTHPRNLPSPWSAHFAPRREYDGGALAWRSALAFIRSREAARALESLLRRVRPDVAHLHNIYHQLTPSIIEVLSRARIPVVMTLHDYKLACPSYSLFTGGGMCRRCVGASAHHAVLHRCGGSLARSLLLATETAWQRLTRAYERVDRFIAPSAFMRSVMVDAGIDGGRIHHVPPFAPEAAPATAGDAAIEGLPERFVAYVGRLSPEKGIGVLLEAMDRLPEIPLVVFGEGPERARLMARAGVNPQVRFAGHVGRGALAAAMPRAAAVILPTLSPENAPLAIVEAASAGVPVIVSDRGGLPELAAALDGVPVPAHDAAALAAAIEDVWRDPGAARKRAVAAWERSRARFGVEPHLDAVEAVYREASASARGRRP